MHAHINIYLGTQKYQQNHGLVYMHPSNFTVLLQVPPVPNKTLNPERIIIQQSAKPNTIQTL